MYYHLNMSPIQKKKLLVRFYLFLSLSLFFFFFLQQFTSSCASQFRLGLFQVLYSQMWLSFWTGHLYTFFSFSHPIANREHHNTAINSKRLSLKTPKLNSWWSQWQFTFLLTSSKGLSDKWSHQILITTHDMNKEDVISSYYNWEN